MVKLTPALIASYSTGNTVTDVQNVNCSNKNIDELDDLSPCIELRKLDLSNNSLNSLEGISHNYELSWLNAAHNKLDDLQHLSRLQGLTGNTNELFFINRCSFKR